MVRQPAQLQKMFAAICISGRPHRGQDHSSSDILRLPLAHTFFHEPFPCGIAASLSEDYWWVPGELVAGHY